MTKEESLQAVRMIYGALDEKKALDIKVIAIDEISSIADYFVIASGSNDHQIEALVDAVDEKMEKAGFPASHVEGFRRGGWTLLEFRVIVVHIFDTESCDFYDIERIWKDGHELTEEELKVSHE